MLQAWSPRSALSPCGLGQVTPLLRGPVSSEAKSSAPAPQLGGREGLMPGPGHRPRQIRLSADPETGPCPASTPSSRQNSLSHRSLFPLSPPAARQGHRADHGAQEGACSPPAGAGGRGGWPGRQSPCRGGWVLRSRPSSGPFLSQRGKTVPEELVKPEELSKYRQVASHVVSGRAWVPGTGPPGLFLGGQAAWSQRAASCPSPLARP